MSAIQDRFSRGPRGGRRRLRLASALVLVATATLLAGARQAPVPALSREQMREFLATAPIVKSKDTEKGITRPTRVTLSDGTLTHDAVFSTVDEQRQVERFEGGRIELDFVDSYKYTLAADRLASLVGLDDMMPVHVEREWRGRRGALSWLVDNVTMDEAERIKRKVKPPDPLAWNHQMYRMRLFGQLVADTDRNAGNILIDQDWKLWMIDFTRAFRPTKTVAKPAELKKCDRQLLDRLRGLTIAQVAESTRPYLENAQIEPLLARRDQIVAICDRLVAEKGEAQVLY